MIRACGGLAVHEPCRALDTHTSADDAPLFEGILQIRTKIPSSSLNLRSLVIWLGSTVVGRRVLLSTGLQVLFTGLLLLDIKP
jgi:hypothetical protein